MQNLREILVDVRQGSYVINGNTWHRGKFTYAKALEASLTLINCTDCVNCINCVNCDKCIDCLECIDCISCICCSNCTNCDKCTQCKYNTICRLCSHMCDSINKVHGETIYMNMIDRIIESSLHNFLFHNCFTITNKLTNKLSLKY